MNAHFKGQLDSILLVEQRRRSRRKMYKKFIRQWYDVVLRDGVRSIVDRRLEHQERTMVNYGKSEGVKHVEATFAKSAYHRGWSYIFNDWHKLHDIAKKKRGNQSSYAKASSSPFDAHSIWHLPLLYLSDLLHEFSIFSNGFLYFSTKCRRRCKPDA